MNRIEILSNLWIGLSKSANNNELNVRYKKIEDIVKIIQNPINVSLKTQNILIKKNNANNIVILSMIK